MPTNSPIFKDLIVLELANVLAGPTVGQFFAECGATVIKVENPLTKGDVTRSWRTSGEDAEEGMSAYFATANWGKKSIALNLAQPQDLALLRKLMAKAQIVLSSYKPGDAAKWGLDFASVKEVNPHIIYGAITGFNHSQKVAYDAIVQAESGFMFMNGQPTGEATKMPVALIDLLAAHQLKEGLLLALWQQQAQKQAVEVRVSLMDAALAALANQSSNWLNAQHEPQRMGNEHPNIAPYGNVYQTADEKGFMLTVSTNKQFKALRVLLKLPDDPAFATNALRVQNRHTLHQLLQKAIGQIKGEALTEGCLAAHIPFGEIKPVSAALETYGDTLLLQAENWRNMRTTVASNVPKLQLSPPPRLNQHAHWVRAFAQRMV